MKFLLLASMTEDDKLILTGIITVAICLIVFIVSAVIIEKKIEKNNYKWLSYLGIFLLGLLLLFIWPFPSEGEKFIITPPTLIGACFAAFSPFAFLISLFKSFEINMTKKMINEALLVGKALNLKTNGADANIKTPPNELRFSYSGFINNTWAIYHYDLQESIPSTKTFAEKAQNPYTYQKYNRYSVYYIKLNINTQTELVIIAKSNENQYGYTKNGFQLLNTRFKDFNEQIVIYYKTGEENISTKLQNPLFRKLLVDHRDLFKNGIGINREKGEFFIRINKYYPITKMFERNLSEKFLQHDIDEKTAHLKFFTKFLIIFDN
jgi:hypothetical protein